MASSFRSTCRAGRSSLSQLLHRRSQHQEQLSDQTSSFLARFMSTGRLFVGGLSWETDESQLKDAFSSFGEVTDACIVMDKETGQSKGFGFVSFALPSHADAAVKTMNGRDLHGKILRVNFAMNRTRGSGGFGGSGGAGGDYGGGRGGGYGGGGYGGYSDGGSGGAGGDYGGGRGGGYGGGGYGGYSDGGSTGGYGAGSYNGNAYATGPAGSYGGSATRNLYTESNKSFFNNGDFSNDTSANNPGNDSYSSSYDKREMH